MTPQRIRFDRFELDLSDRRLTRDGRPVAVSARYMDALILMAREPGRLVTKARLLNEVWAGVPVTDEAVTQCVRTLRRALGDDAARPRFIATEPKHGYRFIAVLSDGPAPGGSENGLEPGRAPDPIDAPDASAADMGLGRQGLAGGVGGAAAGAVGGLAYGLMLSGSPGGPGGASLALMTLAGATVLAATAGAAVVLGAGVAVRALGPRLAWRMIGGAVGGLVVGAVVRLALTDALMLLTGGAVTMTGAPEGALLGAAVGLASALAEGRRRRTAAAVGAGLGLTAGALIALLGGRLLAGSLATLDAGVDGMAFALAGPSGIAPTVHLFSAMLEGGLFAACVCVAVRAAADGLGPSGRRPPVRPRRPGEQPGRAQPGEGEPQGQAGGETAVQP